MERVVLSWGKRGIGICFRDETDEEKRLVLLIWADNLYFFAKPLSELQLMYKETTTALEEVQLYWKPESLEYITSIRPETALPEWTIELQEAGSTTKGHYPCIRREIMKVLGTEIRWDGCSWTALYGRLKIARGIFFFKSTCGEARPRGSRNWRLGFGSFILWSFTDAELSTWVVLMDVRRWEMMTLRKAMKISRRISEIEGVPALEAMCSYNQRATCIIRRKRNRCPTASC